MTPNEQQLLEQFLQRVNAAQGVAPDPQAYQMIQQRLAQQPDATYLLVQRALLLEHALDNARQQIQQLQQQVQSQNAGSSFLGQSLDTQFGRNPTPAQPSYSEPPRYASPTSPEPGSWRQRWFGAAPAGQAAAAAAPSSPAPMATPASAGSSWLGSAASAAAGVAGGMFLFNGLESLLGNHHGGLGSNANALTGQSEPSHSAAQSDAGNSTLAQDAGASHVQDQDSWSSSSSDDGGSFLDDDNSWDA